MICIKAVAIIPARGGSKGIPRKNIKELCGKPLIGHIIETALEVDELDRVIVSTEDAEIADVAKKFGAEIPFIRPEELARDETPTLPVLQHTVEYLEKEENYYPDIIVLLYPTSPLLSNERVSEGIKLLKKENFDSVISVVEDKGHYWIRSDSTYKRLYPRIIRNRQLTEPLYRENGAIYVSKRNIMMSGTEFVGENIGFIIMSEKESIDIDNLIDFKFVQLLKNNY
ncbi:MULTISPECIES: acylneuraminate cytidylyltransferase family protein [Methanohalophilus]|uniref:N-acylneuraminate cytidylyltransferase/CMP-N,N'-diacetyllegionaminic acid synthase n=1 Tax=Methanohalophilus euhalobius TaxID=51203 RepID=A0A315B6Z1_9EURY|nr:MULTISPECIES: acylneuraminate cytidylyltransferase family protein [Methanohalophilus]OBZ34777.1 MAG: hypothetical protein A9957_09630 [Methanohalophilus sp. DAL1]PQV41840.1 N-acylneuraminate cytidylyltransferase/CMP-N,N'-diacetyllegionaminic acid synthase [Methanohalophilus euhalobius]